MARRARFGRLPRSAPSLTATIVALAQEYQRVRDTNIEDAWKNGGQFEGKKVTDEQMLKYWTERRDGVSKDDPMWDYYNNQLHGYQFNIDESKEYLKYKQNKISEGEMAAFYAKWAQKMPVNSANYRMLMTKSAEFRDAAARGRSSSDYAAREARYQKNQNATWDKYEKPWDTFESSIMEFMVQEGHVDRNSIDSSNNGGWAAFHDPAILNQFLYRLNNDPAMAGDKKRLADAMGPAFGGEFTEADLDKIIRRKNTGVAQEKTRAIKSGNHDADVTKLTKEQQITDAASVSIGTADFQEIADRKGRELNNVLADPTATPDEVDAAIKETRDWFATEGKRMVEDELPSGFDPLSGKPHNQFAVDLMGRVNGTISALDGKAEGLTVWDDPYGNRTGEASSGTMAFKVAEQAGIVGPQAEAIRTGQAVLMAIGEDKKSTSGTGSGWAVVPLGDPRLMSADIFIMPNPKGLPQAFKGAPITIEAYKGMDPNTRQPVGDKVQINRDETQGFTVDVDSGGGTLTKVYGIYVDGELRWTHVSPIPVTDTSMTTVDPKTGATVIKGIAPNGKADPDNWIDRDSLMTTKTGPAGDSWVVGSQGSILQATMRASDADARRIANMDDDAYMGNEADYYTIHPTKAMQNAKALGGEQGFQAAMGDEIRKSVNLKQSIRVYGPESQRDQVISMMQAQATAATAERLRRQATDDAGLRASLVNDVTSWQNDHASEFSADMAARLGYPWGAPPPGTQLPSLSSIPGGSKWTLQSLLTSPQISTAHAQQIAAYLTSGGVAGEPAQVIPGSSQQVTVPNFTNPTTYVPNIFKSLAPRSIPSVTGTVTTPTQVVAAPKPSIPAAVPSPTTIPVTGEVSIRQQDALNHPVTSVGLNSGQTHKVKGGGFQS